MNTWRWLMGWIQSVGFTTQSAHMGWGAAVPLLAITFGLHPSAAILLFFFLWVAPKEFVFDACRDGEGHGHPDLMDASFYVAGELLVVASILVSRFIS